MARRGNPYCRDPGTRKAAELGYPARSVFKLEEIDRRLSLLASGQVVLDLGAAPGSWARYAAQRVSSAGSVVAVDLVALAEPVASNIRQIVADARLGNEELRRLAPYDVVLSDMAPKTSGSKVRDQALSEELFLSALRLGAELGRVRSSFVGKLFMSGSFDAVRHEVERVYRECRVLRPRGTRPNSFEIFLVGRDKA